MPLVRSARERDRLLRQSARSIGLLIDATAIALVLGPGAVAPDAVPFAVALLLGLAVLHLQLGRSGRTLWVLLLAAGGLALSIGLASAIGVSSGFEGYVLVGTANAVTSTVAVVVTTSVRRLLLLLPVLVPSVVVSVLVAEEAMLSNALVQSLLPWGTLAGFALWISTAVPRVVRRIDSIGNAHRVERQASETEAQRRQGARLLHDTVLATLTLLAHSGRGVSEDALRRQAAQDAQLLRQLRLGGTPTPSASGSYQLTSVTASPAATSLEDVRDRFGRLGLEVVLHGSGEVVLEGAALDSFLLALAECLENVRRHSGVESADVTITEDEQTVRAMVTDAGAGFDIATVPATKLGFKESVVARLADVGGRTRLFSSPGSGTTVVLEVPK
ncbi:MULTISPECIES: sensor histidine kinase [unclassified Rathayibacter]|uniref:sensor histidine kinase n=1 Tax=unclassified Rathayibacter TaxID=2609250 RepID=UPI000F9ADDD9|nr:MULTISPECIES: ATP-binding protein [unclassified Rathayibacter]ROP57624.1 signal transduction histidine kinase [Rathayibacter sp. PhB186]ROS56009.1 signal transduction histidine kinase [Rathayibacter sp. PhB185]